MPHFGILEDDGIYLIGAKSLAQGHGYRILNVPGAPLQTKYPPLYPWYLSIAASSSLAAVCVLSFLSFPVVLALMLAWYKRNGFDARAAWILTALFALNPYVMFFVANLGSEVFFMVFLFVAMFFAERAESARFALLAGVAAGVAYLARTAGVAMLPAAILYYEAFAHKDRSQREAAFVWENDTALFLATGRPSVALIIPPSFSYVDPDASELPFYQSLDRYANDHGISHVVLPKVGPHEAA